MEDLQSISLLIIGIFISFIFLLTMRSVAPELLLQTRQIFFHNLILSLIALISIGLVSYSMDEETGVYGIIGMTAVFLLFIILSHPSTFPRVESFENDEKEKNVKDRAVEIINDLLTSVSKAHAGIASLPSTQGLESYKRTLEEVQTQLVNVVKGSRVESFATRKIQLNKATKEKIDSIVKSILEEEENQATTKEFCENEYIFQFIRYMLKVNPSAFFDEAGPNGLDGDNSASSGEETNEEEQTKEQKKKNETLTESKTLDVFKKRALALFNILRKRKQFGCTKILTICCLDEVKDGVIPTSDLEFSKRTFSMTADQVQSMLENPSRIVNEINVSFKEIGQTQKQKVVIKKIMELMAFLKMSQAEPNKCTDIYVNV